MSTEVEIGFVKNTQSNQIITHTLSCVCAGNQKEYIVEIVKIGNVSVLAHVQEEPLEQPFIRVRIDGAEDNTSIVLYKNGRAEDSKKYLLDHGVAFPKIEAGKYTLCVGYSKVRFTVYESDGKLYVKKAKEDPQKTVTILIQLCLELFNRIEEQKKRIDDLNGYDVE